jgi:hypothetical protein
MGKMIEYALEVDIGGPRPGYAYLVRSSGFSAKEFIDPSLTQEVQLALECRGCLLFARNDGKTLLIRTAAFAGFDHKKRPVAASRFALAPSGLDLRGQLLALCVQLIPERWSKDERVIGAVTVPFNARIVRPEIDDSRRLLIPNCGEGYILSPFLGLCVNLRLGSLTVLCVADTPPEGFAPRYERQSVDYLLGWLESVDASKASSDKLAVVETKYEATSFIGEERVDSELPMVLREAVGYKEGQVSSKIDGGHLQSEYSNGAFTSPEAHQGIVRAGDNQPILDKSSIDGDTLVVMPGPAHAEVLPLALEPLVHEEQVQGAAGRDIEPRESSPKLSLSGLQEGGGPATHQMTQVTQGALKALSAPVQIDHSIARINFDRYDDLASLALKKSARKKIYSPGKKSGAEGDAQRRLEEILFANREIFHLLNSRNLERQADLIFVFDVWTKFHLLNVMEYSGSKETVTVGDVFRDMKSIDSLKVFGEWAIRVVPSEFRASFRDGFIKFSGNAFRLFINGVMSSSLLDKGG